MGADSLHLEPALETIKAILILDNNGSRILAKYFDTSVLATSVEQKKFEKNLFNKTHKALYLFIHKLKIKKFIQISSF